MLGVITDGQRVDTDISLNGQNGDSLDVVNRLFNDTQLLSFVVELS
jgi:hypothetical protein